jgi:pilus assembly protein CpaC
MLRVRIAEVSRSYIRELGVNLAGLNPINGFNFLRSTRVPTSVAGGGITFGSTADGGSSVGGGLGIGDVDIAAAIDGRDNNGHVTILAEPNLTSLSGETANFLAGGEFPVPIAQTLGQVTIEYKQYGVGLAFTPFVLADGPHLDAGPPGGVGTIDRRQHPPERLRRAGADHAARGERRSSSAPARAS